MSGRASGSSSDPAVPPEPAGARLSAFEGLPEPPELVVEGHRLRAVSYTWQSTVGATVRSLVPDDGTGPADMSVIRHSGALEIRISGAPRPVELTIRFVSGFDEQHEPVAELGRFVFDRSARNCVRRHGPADTSYAITPPAGATFATVDVLYHSPGMGLDVLPFNVASYAFQLLGASQRTWRST